MFFSIYLWRELSRRMRQAVVITLGLAVGVGLVVTVAAASTGVKGAESQVLGALDGIGTDVTVTGVTTVTGLPPTSLPAGTSTGISEGADGPQECFVGEGCKSVSGTTVSFVGSPYSSISTSQVTEVGRLHDVTGAVGGLMLLDQTATFPKVTAHTLTLLNNVYLDGVDTTHTSLGPLSTAKVVAGHELTAADRDSAVAVVDSGFAAANNLKTGSSLVIGTTSYTVVGIITQPQVSNPTDIYIPLAQAEALPTQPGRSLRGEVNTIYVSAAISTVRTEITSMLPRTQIATQSSLASQVTGSISSAEKLAADLGRWLAILVLIAAFAGAALLTMAAVNRRATDFGTLKALGWRSWRIIGQVLGESVTMGVAGAVAGVGLGYAGAGIIGAIAPKLSAVVPQNFNPNSYTPNPAKGSRVSLSADVTAGTGGKAPTPTHLHAGTGEPSLSHTVAITLHPSITLEVIALAVALALLGGLIAGTLASWRIARLRPATTLGRVA